MNNRNGRILGLTLAILPAASCTSLRDHPALDAMQAAKQGDTKTYLEAYIEYPGPQERWAGPVTWMVHAKVANPPQIVVTPADPASPAAAPAVERVPAGAAAVAPLRAPTGPGGVTAEVLKDRLQHLASWIEQDESTFRSCLSPIRVRMIRVDGALLERRGCRMQTAWSTQVSALTNELISYAHGENPLVPAPSTVQSQSIPAAALSEPGPASTAPHIERAPAQSAAAAIKAVEAATAVKAVQAATPGKAVEAAAAPAAATPAAKPAAVEVPPPHH